MKLLKAKEIIDLNIKEGGRSIPPDVKTALTIGSEALGRLEYQRRMKHPGYSVLLPSETLD